MDERKIMIEIEDITVRFNMASERIDNLKEYIIKLLKRELMFQEFLALKHVSLTIRKGEAWGLIGTNGSGKSTLLKLICGILKPYKGKVTVSGSIAPLIELGAGFDPELTARENIFLNGAVLGYDEIFMQEHFEEIVAFAELQNFLDMPIKNYSSGMAARLGFAIATMVKTDILICDEVLAVGDFAFQQKCEIRMRELLSGGTTLLYVSHDIQSVKRLCDHAVWLEKGDVVMQGNAITVCEEYMKDLIGEMQEARTGEPVEYILIQAGGKGTRLKELTKNKPKGIVPVHNLPILFHLFRRYPDKRYVIIGDYQYDVLERYLEAFGNVNYITVKAEGTGTCAGIKKALDQIPDHKRFLLIWSDLILNPEIDIDLTEGNLIGISKSFPCRWSYQQHKFVEQPSSEQGVAGFFLFQKKELIEDVPLEGEFVRWLQEKELDFNEFSLEGTIEAGTLIAIEEANKREHTYRCRAFNSIEVQDNILIKRPLDEQGRSLAAREIQWYQKVKEFPFHPIPIIYEYNPLTMKKIEGENIFRVSLTVEQKKRVIDRLVSSLNQLHSFSSVPCDSFSILEAYYHKTFVRLDQIRNMIPFAEDREIRINGKKCKNPYYLRSELKKRITDLFVNGTDKFVLIHGDCTFSNTMIDSDFNVTFLDPRGYFGFTELYGDAYYDWAKLYYSIYGDYDQFNNKNFDLSISDTEVIIQISSNGWRDVADYYLSQLPDCNKTKIQFLHALIWLSLTTYAWEDYDSVCGAFYNGTLLLEEIMEQDMEESVWN